MEPQKRYTVNSVGAQIQNFLKRVLRLARLRLNFTISEPDPSQMEFETPDLVVKFTGPDAETLLANKAELLLALEHLCMEMLRVPPEDHSLLCFDANDYRLLRIEELRLSAMAAAERVRLTGVPFRFNPMTSRERRIVHLALRHEAEIRSESTGMGPQRSVVVLPAEMPMPDNLAPPAAPWQPPRSGRRR